MSGGLDPAGELASGEDCRDSVADCQLPRCGDEFTGLGTARDRVTSAEHFQRAERIERRGGEIKLLLGNNRSLPNRSAQPDIEFVEPS